MKSKRVIIDHDGAYEDVTATLYLLKHPKVQVEAILITGSGLFYSL